MALKIVKNQLFPIGLDLGSSTIKLAQLRSAGDVTELLAAGTVEVSRDIRRQDIAKRFDATGEAIRCLVKANPFKGRQCVVSLPTEFAFVHHLRIPKLSAKEIPGCLQFELQGKLPFSTDDAVIRYVVAGDVFNDGEPRQEVIVVAASRDTIDRYIRMVNRAGLEVVGMNIEACAVVECFARLFRRDSDAARTILYVDIGSATTQVALSHGNRLVFARNLMIGGQQLDQAVADGLKIPIDHARLLRRDPQNAQQDSAAVGELYHLMQSPLGNLAEELIQCLHYYESVFRNQAVERAIFVGGQAYDKRLCQSLAQRLNLPAQVGDPLMRIKRIEGAGLPIGLDRREPQPDWAVAVGLSIGAASAA
jgi:type IV pilus assembly protein PilM